MCWLPGSLRPTLAGSPSAARQCCHNVFLTRAAAAALLLLSFSACERPPEVYPPPEQRHPLEGINPGPDAMMVEMSSPDAKLSIVKDVYEPGGTPWRWTEQDPTVKVLVLSTDNLKLSADFALWDDGFKSTGPVGLTFFVNGKMLDSVRYTTPGVKHYENPVPAGWIMPDTEVPISFHVDKLYVSPRDQKRFGVILTRIGLVP